MVRTLLILLIVLLGVFHVSLAGAQTTCASNVTIRWTYHGLDCYSSQAAALAAMHSDSPGNALLTKMAKVFVGLDGKNTITYQYVAPSPIPLVNPTTVYASTKADQVTYPDEQAVIANYANVHDQGFYQNACGTGNFTLSATSGDWIATGESSVSFPTSYLLPSVPTTPYVRYWDFNYWSMGTNGDGSLSCHWATAHNFIEVWRWQAASCPAYYYGTLTQCMNDSSSQISSSILDCPKPSTLVGDPCDARSGE